MSLSGAKLHAVGILCVVCLTVLRLVSPYPLGQKQPWGLYNNRASAVVFPAHLPCRDLVVSNPGWYGPLKSAPDSFLEQLEPLSYQWTPSERSDVTVLAPAVELEDFYSQFTRGGGEGGEGGEGGGEGRGEDGRRGFQLSDCPTVRPQGKSRNPVELGVPVRVVSATMPRRQLGRTSPSHEDVLLFLLSASALDQATQDDRNLTILYRCVPQGEVECWNLVFRDHALSHLRSRSAQVHHPRSLLSLPTDLSHRDRVDSKGFLPLLAALGVVGVGVVGLVAVLALCAGSSTKTYQPAGTVTNFRVMTSEEVAKNNIPGVTMTTPDQQTEGSQEVAATNGLSSQRTMDEANGEQHSSGQQKSGSPLSEGTDSSEREVSPHRGRRVRTVSGRSQEPLPEIPMAGEKPVLEEQPSKENEGEHEYAYARVSPADQMKESDSEGEGENEGEDESPIREAIPLPVMDPTKVSYGKVTKPPSSSHEVPVTKPEEPEDKNYAEVRETSRYHPRGKGARGRSATEPLEPASGVTREHRAFTESATHLPLPAIPNLEVNDQMYDSIPEDLKTTKARKKAASQPHPKRERFYEAVDDMDKDGPEDTYETVPDDIKHGDPIVTVTPTASAVPLPSLSPSKHHSPSATAPAPPASPIPRKYDRDERKKKELAKTVSDSESRKPRTFSLFTRKKTASVSAGSGKTRSEREEPVPFPQGPVARHPPAIPPPAPPLDDDDDEEDDTYETPDRPPHLDGKRLFSDSDASPSLRRHEIEIAKSASLPMSMRSGPGFFNPKAPLPELPEDSGSGAVAVGLPPRPPSIAAETPEDEPNYDSLVPQQLEDEYDPYDTVNQAEILQILNEGEEPGYDRVKGKVEPGGAEAIGPPGEEGREDEPLAAVAGYGKVTTPGEHETTPEHDDLGYAVVPQEFRMRKRTMSEARQLKEKDPGYSSVKEVTEAIRQLEEEAGYDRIRPIRTGAPSGITPEDVERERSPTGDISFPSTEMEDENYASIDLDAKWASRQKQTATEGEDLEPGYDELQGVTPPPPIPAPATDLGFDLTEFQQPIVPVHSDRALQLVSDTDDPDDPYAKVLPLPASGNDHPYTEVDILDDPPYAKVTKKDEPPYASISQMRARDERDDEATGYDTADVVVKVTSQERPAAAVKDDALGYDTVGEKDVFPPRLPQNMLERDMPKLETVEVVQPMYDRLEPEVSPQQQPLTYDRLGLAETEGGDRLRPPSEEQNLSQDSYEEIDENSRLKYLESYLQRRS